MKKIVTLLLFILVSHLSFSQVWKNLTSLSPGHYSRCGSFAIGDTGYVIEGSYQNNTYAYDTASPHNWTPVTNYPINTTDGTVGTSLNGIGYAGTGAAGGYQFNNSFYQYVPSVGGGTWTQLPNVPGLQRAYGVAFTLDGKVYIGGGLYNNGSVITPLNDFYGYNTVTRKWDTIASCPALGVSCDAAAFVIGDTVYVGTGGMINGSGQSVPQRDFWKYDTTSKTWTEIASLPGKQRAEASAFATCDEGYVGLGYINIPRDTDAADFWQYSPPSGAWVSVGNFPGGARNAAPAFTIGKVGYVVGGSITTGSYLNDLWSYVAVVTPAFSSVTSVCQGGSIAFTDTSNFFPDHWLWQFSGGNPSTDTIRNPTIEYDTAGTYNIILTAWNSCDSGTQTFTNYITVGIGGSLTIKPASPSVCSGQSVTLSVIDTGTFTWSPSFGLSATTGDSVMANPTVSTLYRVTGTDSVGCSATGTDSVTVISAPPLIILPQPPPIFCNGLSATLKISGSGKNFVWMPSTGLSASTGDSVIASPTISTTYTVTGTDSLGCVASGVEPVTVIVSPNKPTFTQDGDTLISSSKYDNQWYRNDTLLQNDTSQHLIITKGGQYWVIVNNEANGCSTSSDSTQITGINQLSLIANQLTIYPNPFNNDIFIKINLSAGNLKDWKLEITDVLGRTLVTRSSLYYSNEMDLSNLSSGVYFITVINKTGQAVFPVVKQDQSALRSLII